MEKVYDCNNLVVGKNDYLLYDQGDFVWFFKLEEGKLKYFANWQMGSLGLINPNGEISKETNEWLKLMKSSHLQLVKPELEKYLIEIQNNKEGHMPLYGSLENPTEEYPGEE